MTKEAAYITARKKWDKLQLRVYKCPYCRGYHVSHHKQKRLDKLFELIEKERKQI